MDIFIFLKILLAYSILIYSIYVILGCMGYALLKNLEYEIKPILYLTYWHIFTTGVFLFVIALFLGIYLLLNRIANGIIHIAKMSLIAWRESIEEVRDIKRAGWDK